MIVQKLIGELGPWLWWIVGLLLLGLEVLAPGTFFLWFGVSALVVGTLAIFVEMAWQVEIVLFGVLSLVSLLAGRRLMRDMGKGAGDPGLNRRGARLVGQTHRLSEPMVDGAGRLVIDDSVWRVRGGDFPAGTLVRITEVDGATLVVEPENRR
jgi:hypothetical protein